MRRAVVVSGLPASGKTTLARQVAEALGFVFLDKDDFLEALYDTHPVRSWADRAALSRQSDGAFEQAAQEAHAVVLVSHWRAPGARGNSGTPSDWVSGAFDNVVELCCLCDPAEATARFQARQRHPSHLDATRDPVELAQKMQDWADRFPLGLGEVVTVRTDEPVDVGQVVLGVRRALGVD